MSSGVHNKNLPIPATIKDIDPQWVQIVTGHEACTEGFHIEGDIQAGIGFLSSICRVSYKTRSGEKKDIIVKLLPTDSKWLEFALSDSSDEREIQFYSIVLPDLVQVCPELQNNVCLFYNGAVEPASKSSPRKSMLIVEDLKPLGFKMMPFGGDISGSCVDQLITFMARLHFAASAIEVDKGVHLPALYPFMQGISENLEWKRQVKSMCDNNYAFMETMLSSNHVHQNVFQQFAKLKPYTNILVDKIENSGRLHPCLIHGDIWPPNLQVHENLPVKVLDWQLLGYRDVTFDLSITLGTVLTKENLTADNLRRYVRQYHEEFEELCKGNGYDTKIKRRTWEEFETFFFTWALAYGYLIYLSSLDCYEKDFAKYANIIKVMCDDIKLPEFLLSVCTA